MKVSIAYKDEKQEWKETVPQECLSNTIIEVPHHCHLFDAIVIVETMETLSKNEILHSLQQVWALCESHRLFEWYSMSSPAMSVLETKYIQNYDACLEMKRPKRPSLKKFETCNDDILYKQCVLADLRQHLHNGFSEKSFWESELPPISDSDREFFCDNGSFVSMIGNRLMMTKKSTRCLLCYCERQDANVENEVIHHRFALELNFTKTH